ncbi:plasmid pRiA4b ORF-3 family protein [Streptomyces sp. NPDC001633]|uniref:plasmid pRiA4b ORF-3 family protein n=1 Tax=Streptomyces sp. NPDC001633 TaxID=3364595 RepID=UPI00368BBB08
MTLGERDLDCPLDGGEKPHGLTGLENDVGDGRTVASPEPDVDDVSGVVVLVPLPPGFVGHQLVLELQGEELAALQVNHEVSAAGALAGLREEDLDLVEPRGVFGRVVDGESWVRGKRSAKRVNSSTIRDDHCRGQRHTSRRNTASMGGRMAAMANSRSAKPTSRTTPGKTVHKIKITLRDSRPPIWRRLEVPSGITLRELHDVVQAAFGWEDYHMWAFESGRDRYGIADRDLGIRSAASKQLRQVAARTGDRLRYTYDFGDGWEHDILTENVTEPEPDTAYPRCVTGRRACPPEDCGGILGYDYLIEILADPHHEEHEDRLEWLGLDSADQFDPTAFDAAEVNSALSVLRTVLAKN